MEAKPEEAPEVEPEEAPDVEPEEVLEAKPHPSTEPYKNSRGRRMVTILRCNNIFFMYFCLTYYVEATAVVVKDNLHHCTGGTLYVCGVHEGKHHGLGS